MSNPETEEIENQMKLIEKLYNCSECSSPIEILTIDEKECSIEFNCINNNHKKKMPIKEYLDKMKKYNDKSINKAKCTHNDKYCDCYCLYCNKHLCKECLKTREHINHQKKSIIEIQPNKNELNIIKNIIEFYEDNLENLKKEKIKKTSKITYKYAEYKKILNERKDLQIKEEKDKSKKKLELYKNKFISDINNILKKYENEIKEKKNIYIKNIDEIINKYLTKIESYNILYNHKMKILDDKYTKIVQKCGYNEKIENFENIKRLNEIIYNTYIDYNK